MEHESVVVVVVVVKTQHGRERERERGLTCVKLGKGEKRFVFRSAFIEAVYN